MGCETSVTSRLRHCNVFAVTTPWGPRPTCEKGSKMGSKMVNFGDFRVFLTKCLSSLPARLKTRQKRDRGRDFWVYMLWKNDDIFDDFLT